MNGDNNNCTYKCITLVLDHYNELITTNYTNTLTCY